MRKASNVAMPGIRTRPDNRTVAHAFDKIAFGYNLWSFITESDALKKAYEFCRFQNGMTVLEAGMGTGHFFKWLVETNPDGVNIGLDLSSGMLSRSKQYLHEFNKYHYQLIRGDILNLPLGEESCDRIISTFVFDLLEESSHVQILKQMYRLLQRNGEIILVCMTRTTHITHKFWGWVAETFPALFTYCTPTNIKPALQESGFKIEKNEIISQNTFPSEVTLAKKNSAA